MSEVRDMPALVHVAVRHVGPYNEVGPSFDRIIDWASSKGLMTRETKVIGLAWDDPYRVPAEKLRYDAGITIPGWVEPPEFAHISALPAMSWFMGEHLGSFANMPESFRALGRELSERRDLIQVPMCSLEIYVSEPNTPEAELRTEIGFAVVRLG